MRRILLDTSAYSAFKRGHDDIRTILQEADDITVTPVVLGELYAGFARGRPPTRRGVGKGKGRRHPMPGGLSLVAT